MPIAKGPSIAQNIWNWASTNLVGGWNRATTPQVFTAYLDFSMEIYFSILAQNRPQTLLYILFKVTSCAGNLVVMKARHANLHIVQARLVKPLGFGQRRNSNTVVKEECFWKDSFHFFHPPVQFNFIMHLRIMKRYGFNTAPPTQRAAGNILFICKIIHKVPWDIFELGKTVTRSFA